MNKLTLDYNEQWILHYGGYENLPSLSYEPLEIEIDIEEAKLAEKKAYRELIENDTLLRSAGYRERRLNSEAHYSLKEKLNKCILQ